MTHHAPPPRVVYGFLHLLLLLLIFLLVRAADAFDGGRWKALEAALPSSSSTSIASWPLVVDSVLTPSEPAFSDSRPTLFRERNGWCPYSQRVWLGLQHKGVPYDTVLIDNMGSRPSWYRGTTPQMRWADGRTQGESLEILRALDEAFPDSPPLYPPGREGAVEALCASFRRCFPRNTRPSSRAAFLFRSGGGPVFRADFEAALDATDALLAETSEAGPWFLGDAFSAADCCFAPFLERYASQLPLLHEGLDPRDGERWPHIAGWFDALEQAAPGYCRCQGDGWSWAKVLRSAGFGNAGAPPPTLQEEAAAAAERAVREANDHESSSPPSDRVAAAHRNWAAYAEGQQRMARAAVEEATPAGAAARVIVARRKALAADAARGGFSLLDTSNQQTEEAAAKAAANGLLSVAEALQQRHELQLLMMMGEAEGQEEELREAQEATDAAVARCVDSAEGRAVVAYLDERMCVPRDMGRLPALEIRRLAADAGAASAAVPP